MLRAEHGRDVEPRRDQRVEAMGEVRGHRGGMGEQGDALALQRLAQGRVGEQAVDAEFHGRPIPVMPADPASIFSFVKKVDPGSSPG